MDLTEGKIIAEHYQLLKQLGHGSFGDVWLAHNMLADIDVAIKFYGTLDMKGLEEFRNEFKITYKLRHPNLLSINHFDVYENCPYLVMPYCANGSVSQQAGNMPESEIWKFILDVSGGLAFLHSQQPPVVHQDIKPDNILITSDGRYVISDFGISRSFRTKLSRTNNTANATSSSGTIAYMGPERFSEKPVVVFASDVWAFGMTIYELMTGDVLWEGMGGCVQLNGARIPVIEGNFSKELTDLVTACLAAETWNRPTAPQINDYASAYLQKKPLPALPMQKNQVAEKTVAVLKHEPSPKPEPAPAPAPAPMPQPYEPSYQIPKVQKVISDRTGMKQGTNQNLKRGLTAAAAVLAAIVLISGAVMFFSSASEDEDFYDCRTKQDYELFIKEHPNSSHVETAQKRIAAMTPATASQENVPISPQEQPASAKTAKTAPAEQPEIVTIPAQEKTQVNEQNTAPTVPAKSYTNNNSSADDQAFYRCISARDYDNYLKKFPNGRHRKAAAEALTNLVSQTNSEQSYPTNNIEETNIVDDNHRVGRMPMSGSNPPINLNSGSSTTTINIGIRGGGHRPSGPSRSPNRSPNRGQGSRGPIRSNR